MSRPHSERLERSEILEHLEAANLEMLAGLSILDEIDSTNGYLMERSRSSWPVPWACVAETQTAGRGRRGRGWYSPAAGNIYLSALLRPPGHLHAYRALGLAMGTAIADALDETLQVSLQLKWPNDLTSHGRKVGGILLESRGESDGTVAIVAGIGLNLRMNQASDTSERIDQPWSDLESVLGAPVSRNAVAGTILNAILECATDYSIRGFPAWQARFDKRDALCGGAVTVHAPDGTWAGQAQGVDHDGALLVLRDGRQCRVESGEVSVRSAVIRSRP